MACGPGGRMGGAGFEPAKACANRFTVCPLWPLGYPPGEHPSRASGAGAIRPSDPAGGVAPRGSVEGSLPTRPDVDRVVREHPGAEAPGAAVDPGVGRRCARGQRWDSNPQPPDYKSGALPVELRWRTRSGGRLEALGPAGRGTGAAGCDGLSSRALPRRAGAGRGRQRSGEDKDPPLWRKCLGTFFLLAGPAGGSGAGLPPPGSLDRSRSAAAGARRPAPPPGNAGQSGRRPGPQAPPRGGHGRPRAARRGTGPSGPPRPRKRPGRR